MSNLFIANAVNRRTPPVKAARNYNGGVQAAISKCANRDSGMYADTPQGQRYKGRENISNAHWKKGRSGSRQADKQRGKPKKMPPGWLENRPRGEKHYLWKGGPALPYGPDWDKISKAIRRRDKRKCLHCKFVEQAPITPKSSLHTHHITRARLLHDNGIYPHDRENLITLCSAHHKYADEHEDWSVPFYRALLIEKYGYEQAFYDNLDAQLALVPLSH